MRIPLIDGLLRRFGAGRHAKTNLREWEAKHRQTIARDLESIWQHLPQDLVFVDVGANIGLFSEAILSDRPRAHGYLFEPVKEMHSHCLQRFGKDPRITLENFALGQEAGTATIYKARYNPGGNSLMEELMFDKRDVSEVEKNPDHASEQIRIEVFDDYAKKKGLDFAHFIKTDTEGFDYRVLEGMMEFLSACNPKPLILSELMSADYHPYWEDQVAVLDRLYSMGYEQVDMSGMDKVQDFLFVHKGA